ncbi:MAG: nucleoid-associated protein EbfC [Nocardioidaceae bacterium]|jgi:DNA-binding YbaB/EbfC family protein|nr:nucleoid-associated protein EbfC [Nocardioidaceae bacterium]MDX6309881.1 nucleoid-associated protein EbfC [Nocardioidaceae bacterium]
MFSEGTPDLQALLQQASLMQERLVSAQEELEEARVEGSAGGGLVHATVTGTGELVSLTLDPSVCDPDDPETLADLVVAAVQNAVENAHRGAAEAMGDLTGDLGGALGAGLGALSGGPTEGGDVDPRGHVPPGIPSLSVGFSNPSAAVSQPPYDEGQPPYDESQAGYADGDPAPDDDPGESGDHG